MTRLALLPLLALVACSGAAPSPVISAVSPASAPADGETVISVLGESFFLEVDARYDSASTAVDARLEVWLGETALAGVTWVSSTEVRASVPAGLEHGAYDVRLRLPSGREARAERAFTVLDEDDADDLLGARLFVMSAIPDALTADGSDTSQIIARLEGAGGDGVDGEELSVQTPIGSAEASDDLGDGRYRVRFRAPTEAAEGFVTLTLSVEGHAEVAPTSVRLSLYAPCGSAAVSSASALRAALAAAVDGDVICVPADTSIVLDGPISATARLTLLGEARAQISRGSVGSAEVGLALTGAETLVRDLGFVGFGGTSLAIGGAQARVERCRFEGGAVVVTGPGATIGPDNDFSGGAATALAVLAEARVEGNVFSGCLGEGALVIGGDVAVSSPVVVRNLFVANTRAIEIEGGHGARVEGNTFVGHAEDALSIESDEVSVTGLLVRNNIFMDTTGAAIVASDASFAALPSHNDFFANGADCEGCTLAAGGNLTADPAFVDALGGDYRLAAESPCVDAGVTDVTYEYKPPAPDLGAFELP